MEAVSQPSVSHKGAVYGIVGKHVIAEFSGCRNLNDKAFIQRALEDAARACGATVVNSMFHTFSPQGVTGVVLLAESHISIHTWPEMGYAAVDVFTCGSLWPEKAVDYLKEAFQARSIKQTVLYRGSDQQYGKA